MRIGRPTLLADTALSVLLGAAGGLVIAVVAMAGFPDWGETLLTFLVVFAFALPLGLVFRLLLHAGFEYVNHGGEPGDDMPRSVYLADSRPVLRFGAGASGAAVVMSVAFLGGTGDASPG